MSQTVAVHNQKGGVGKTTLTINLGAALAHRGHRVLLIDVDPQGHLTEGVGFQELYLQDVPNLFDRLQKGGELESLVRRHPEEPFSVIPANYQLALAEQVLFMARNREHKLRNLVAPLESQYDWILIDCPPMLGNLTDNALNAARKVIVPIQAEATSVRALELLFDQLESLERGLNIQIEVLAVVPNLVQDSALSRQILTDMRTSVPALAPVELRKRVLVQAAWSAGRSIFGYQARNHNDEQTRLEIAHMYTQLAELLEEKVKGGSGAR